LPDLPSRNVGIGRAMSGRLCGCGADADALTDEAHGLGCPDRPSVRAKGPFEPVQPLSASMGEAELLRFVDREGLDVLVHSPRSRLVVEWTVAAYDYDEPRLAGIGTASTFVVALFEALSAFERCVTATAQADAERSSTRPPPVPMGFIRGDS
jgi:hypothetical protein